MKPRKPTARAISGAMKLYASVRLDGKLPIVRDPFQYTQGHDIDAAHHAIEEKLAEKDKKNV